MNKHIKNIDQMFFEYLSNYDFKGNIRELEHIIERAIALSSDDTLGYMDLPKAIIAGGNFQISDETLIPIFIGETLRDVEKKVINKTYEHYQQNQKKAAAVLGISDRTLRYKLKEQ